MDTQVKGGAPVIKVTLEEQGNDIIAANPVVVFGYFNDQNTDTAKTFLNVPGLVHDLVFAIVSGEEKLFWKLQARDQDIVLWKNGNPIYYKGSSQSDEIVNWLKKKTGPPAIEVGSVEQAKEVITANPVVVFGYFANRETDKAKTFLTVAGLAHEEVFAIVSDVKVIAELEAEDQDVVLFENMEKDRVKYDGEMFTEDAFITWVVVHRVPVFVEYSEQLDERDKYGVHIKYYLEVFLSKKNGDFEKYIDDLKSVAKKYRNKIIVSTAFDVDEDKNQWSLDSCGVKKEDVPCIRLTVDEEDRPLRRYKPISHKLTSDSVEEFIQSFFAGKLKPYLKRQELPADWDKKPVKVLVASNFDEVVYDTNKKVLVDFCTPWCGPCKILEPIFEKLGEKYEKNDDVVIAKMDPFENELEHIVVKCVPTIMLFTKDNQVRKYKLPEYDEVTLEDLINFVESAEVKGGATEPTMCMLSAKGRDRCC